MQLHKLHLKTVNQVKTTKLELTKDELNKMDDVYVYSKTLNEDKHSNSVHYFEFKHFNQPISIRLFCI